MTSVTSPPPSAQPPSSTAPPSVRRGGGGGPRGPLGGPWALLFVVVMFLVLALVTNYPTDDRALHPVELVAQQYADAWTAGNLSSLDYDSLSGPGVDHGDSDAVASRVSTIVHDLDTQGKTTPKRVTVVKKATRFISADHTLATTGLQVTWQLQKAGLTQEGHTWTYAVTLTERESGGVWRVVWTPQTVHPALRDGLVFRVARKLAPRGSLIGAGDTVLPPAGHPALAQAVLGSITTNASTQQASQNPLRSVKGDTVGVAGLQAIFDDRLGGGAEIIVTAGPETAHDTSVLPTQNPLFVGVPSAPTPIQLTVDARTQEWAENALRGVAGPATLVVAQVSTGNVLADANTSTTVDYGLSAQQPPGAIFGLASYLALMRKGLGPNSQVDCTAPYTLPGTGALFRNPPGPAPSIDGVRLSAAIEGGCTTALARFAGTVTPVDVQTAAWDLGLATPLQTTAGSARTPSWLTVADQLGTSAYFGRVASDSAEDIGTAGDSDGKKAVGAVSLAQDLTGSGTVLVSPLSVTRAMVTIARGERSSLRLITNPAPGQSDIVKPLDPTEAAQLQDVLAGGVAQLGGSAHDRLGSLTGSTVYALAATSDYSTDGPGYRPIWVAGYRGDYAFTVLLPDEPAGKSTDDALAVADRFLVHVP